MSPNVRSGAVGPPQASPPGGVQGGPPIKIDKAPARIAGMFDAIAGRYDALNHILSAGIDFYWRRRAIRALELTGREVVLDLCTGTGDVAIAAVRAPRGAARAVVGVDFSGAMLAVGLEKVRRAGLADRISMVRGDAVRVPLAEASVDAATIAFGIRNVSDPVRGCAECFRVLRPGGRLVILEFGLPANPLLRRVYVWYSRTILPRIGRLVSRHREAYDYLPASVAQFPAGDAFLAVLRQAGFDDVRATPLTFGIVYLYVARKG
jgi:demethylmenaquinone methyltransferase / 2-methoxy-6-polyprenyl-1,4-benzoquinol methylase